LYIDRDSAVQFIIFGSSKRSSYIISVLLVLSFDLNIPSSCAMA